eukprot:Opistho-2@28594
MASPRGTQAIQFALVWAILCAMTVSALPPTAPRGIPDQDINYGYAFSYAIPGDVFIDPDTDDSDLTYVVTTTTGRPLPSWLAFNDNDRTFVGIPLKADRGTTGVMVTVFDPDGGSARAMFAINVFKDTELDTAPCYRFDVVTGVDLEFNDRTAANRYRVAKNLAQVATVDSQSFYIINVTSTDDSGDIMGWRLRCGAKTSSYSNVRLISRLTKMFEDNTLGGSIGYNVLGLGVSSHVLCVDT